MPAYVPGLGGGGGGGGGFPPPPPPGMAAYNCITKLSESGSGVLAFLKSDFAQISFYNCKDI